MSKILGVGGSRTGTTSLAKALTILGFHTIDWLLSGRIPKEGWMNHIKKLDFDALTDSPISEGDLFKKLDKEFSNSRFILTLRDEESMRESFLNFFNRTLYKVRDKDQWIYLTKETVYSEVKIIKNHDEEVIQYFEGRDNLLIMNIFEGDGWEKLCAFLEKPIPKRPYPHENESRKKRS